MKNIIAATDFSKTSLNAVNYAADMAAAINAKLVLLHVMHLEVVSEIPDYAIQYEEDIYDRQSARLHRLKQKLEKRVANLVPVVCNLIEGNVNSVIKEVAEDKKPLAIILGSKGAGNLENIVFGSTALHTAKHTQYPVLLIPEKAKFKSVSAIAFATDLFLENSTHLIRDFRKWLNIFNAKLDVVHVNDVPGYKIEKERQFASFKDHLSHYDVYFKYVINDSVTEGISSYIKTNKPDMLVLLYHRDSFLRRLAYKNKFNYIFRHITIPLLVLPG